MKKKDVELVFKGADEKSWQELLDDLRPQGEWIEKVETIQLGHGWLTSHKIVCSVCGGSGESDECIPQNWKFCPNCGADMRERSEEE